MITVSLEEPQPVLPIVQTNVFVPTIRPVTPDVGLPGVVTMAVPAMTVHVPIPTVGVFPANVAVAVQTVWLGPAFAAVGNTSRVIVIVSLDGGHEPLLIVQTKEFAPILKPVTCDTGLPGAVTEPLPAITVQIPVPTVGEFPANVVFAVIVKQDFDNA